MNLGNILLVIAIVWCFVLIPLYGCYVLYGNYRSRSDGDPS